jgi:acyl-CoA thioesterase YciA
VYVGDIVSFYAETRKVGRTSVTVHVTVKADRHSFPNPSVHEALTEAELVYVAVDPNHRPIPIFGV